MFLSFFTFDVASGKAFSLQFACEPKTTNIMVKKLIEFERVGCRRLKKAKSKSYVRNIGYPNRIIISPRHVNMYCGMCFEQTTFTACLTQLGVYILRLQKRYGYLIRRTGRRDFQAIKTACYRRHSVFIFAFIQAMLAVNKNI
jgi:hypothetical protein